MTMFAMEIGDIDACYDRENFEDICPISRVIRRTIGRKWKIGATKATFEGKEVDWEIELPKEVQTFIYNWDHEYEVNPIKFDLDLKIDEELTESRIKQYNELSEEETEEINEFDNLKFCKDCKIVFHKKCSKKWEGCILCKKICE